MCSPDAYISALPVPADGIKQICYAACFIDPGIAGVCVTDGHFVVSLSAEVEPEKIEQGLERLCARFSGVPEDQSDPLFCVEAASDQRFFNADDFAGQVVRIAPGLFRFGASSSSILRFLDWMVLRDFAAPFGATEETYPNVIPIEKLSKTGHFSSFPEHLHFVTHLCEDLDILDSFASRAEGGADQIVPKASEFAGAELVHNPATCYHCYAAREGSPLDENTVVTAVTQCHRYESSNHQQFGRLMEFSLREVVFLGDPDFVRDQREEVLRRVQDWVERWQLFGQLVPANDPFFTNDFAPKAQQQRRLAMKYEYVADLGDETDIAVLSSNLHGPTFGKAFDIKQNGRVVSTGCLGFGLERLAMALMVQHGPSPQTWQGELGKDYKHWKSLDPLS